MPFLRPKQTRILFIALLLTIALLVLLISNQYQIRNTLSYVTRPLWDTADGPKVIVPHYYAEGMDFDAEGGVCGLHGWAIRRAGDRAAGNRERGVVLLDAVLMSSEVELMEIRMGELDSVVDYFFIVESNATFTGLGKEVYFDSARKSGIFQRFENKIVYRFLPGYPLQPGESAWDVEARTRVAMTGLLQEHIRRYPINQQVLVLMSDVDEIPARHTLQLLKTCDFGPSLHLQLRNYLYSFEWYLGLNSWRASIHVWTPGSYYRHSKSTDIALADAGWHCSYCFRTLQEYVLKMRGFSHADRIGGRESLLDEKRISGVICEGKDIFGMLPEAYSYKDLISQMSLEPQKSAVGLPRYLIENAGRFRFLLPGGCSRE